VKPAAKPAAMERTSKSVSKVRDDIETRAQRGDRVIGYLRVVELRKKISGAVIEEMDRDIGIQVNDRVRWTSG